MNHRSQAIVFLTKVGALILVVMYYTPHFFSISTRFSSSVSRSAKSRVLGTLFGSLNIALHISLTSCHKSGCLQNKYAVEKSDHSSEFQVLRPLTHQFVSLTRAILIRALMKPLIVG